MKLRLCSILFLMAAGLAPAAAFAVQTMYPQTKATLVFFDKQNMYPADNADGSTSAFFSWTSCTRPGSGQSMTKTVGGELAPECRPDTLYTWQTNEGFQEFSDAASGSSWQTSFGRGAIFTHINPVATWGYADGAANQIRIKLRPNVKFKVLGLSEPHNFGDYCGLMAADERQTTVVIRVFELGTDYILCSPAVIESWSANTKQAYDEIVASTLWYFNQSAKHNWVPYRELLPSDSTTSSVAPLFISDDTGSVFDGHDFSQLVFAQMMNQNRESTLKYPPAFNYAPDVAPNPRAHFATSHPIYWNTRAH